MSDIDISAFTDAVMNTLKEYTDSVDEKVRAAVDEVSEEAFKIVKAKAPKKTGSYRKAIKLRKVDGAKDHKRYLYATDHYYSLTHLLEHGHKIVGENREKERTASIEHWKIGEEHATEELVKRIEEALTNG